MNSLVTVHPHPLDDPLTPGFIAEAVTLKLADSLTIILSESDPEAAEAWLLDAASKLSAAAERVRVRAEFRAVSL